MKKILLTGSNGQLGRAMNIELSGTEYELYNTDVFEADGIHSLDITDVDAAIYDTVEEANNLECLILDLSSDISLDRLFRPLNNLDPPDSFLSKEKAKGRNPIHA